MVIQCAQCDTRFKVADEKIKNEGIKVRCSKCKHIFTVMPPPPPEEAAPGVPEVVETPPPAPSFNSTEPEEPAAENGPSISFDASQEEETTHHESEAPDWDSFGEVDLGGAKEGDTEPSFDSQDFGTGESSDFPLSGQDDSPGVDLSFETDQDSSGDGPSFSGENLAGGDAFSWNDTGSEEIADFSFDTAAPEDSSSDFDFSNMSFGEEEDESSASGTGDFHFAPAEEPALAAVSAGPLSESPPDSEIPAPPPPRAKPIPYSRRKKKTSSSRPFLLLLLLLVLAGAAGFLYFQDKNIEVSKAREWVSGVLDQITGIKTATAPAGQIRLAELNGSFVNNRHAGQLFVISGKAVNDYSEARSAIAVKGILYSQNGKPLLQQTVFGGNPLNEEMLQELPFAKLEENMNNQFGDSLSNLNVAPGKGIPFTIVFRNLPADLAEFTVEVADSKPGSNQ